MAGEGNAVAVSASAIPLLLWWAQTGGRLALPIAVTANALRRQRLHLRAHLLTEAIAHTCCWGGAAGRRTVIQGAPKMGADSRQREGPAE